MLIFSDYFKEKSILLLNHGKPLTLILSLYPQDNGRLQTKLGQSKGHHRLDAY